MTSTLEPSDLSNEVILHVLVVGFHHKKGCVVEFSYPMLSIDESEVTGSELPELWKHLPTLALPDGAHNYEEDTIYFHLPSLEDPSHTVYGISCYRQMNAQRLLRRSSDITRETVQKSVCVISRLPLFGLIQAKLELITHAYFDERDFSKVSLLEETYRNLNSSLPKDVLDGQQAFLGLSVRDFVLRFKHKSLLLFKLLLLERKVLFFKAPVKDLCSAVLTLCSLVPGLVETGLSEAATSVLARSSPDLLNDIYDGNVYSNMPTGLSQSEEPANETSEFECNFNNNLVKGAANDVDVIPTTKSNCDANDQVLRPCNAENQLSQISSDTEKKNWTKGTDPLLCDAFATAVGITSLNLEANHKGVVNNLEEDDMANSSKPSNMEFNNDTRCLSESDVNRFLGYGNLTKDLSINSLPLTTENQTLSDEYNADELESAAHQAEACDVPNVLDVESSDCGLPLAIFTKGVLCHPYLSLPFLDLLSECNVRGFMIGATNILFKQKKHLFDVIIELEEAKIEILDVELRRNLSLTTEDLRFADHLLRHVMDDKKDVFLDGTGWEGGDEWLRSQFKLYLLTLMRTTLVGDPAGKEMDAFNNGFMSTWKLTHNYRMWSRTDHSQVLKFPPCHPFHGQLSMADMKLKFAHSMQSEKGRKLNSAVASTGKAVLQTGKAVGGALSNAKSAVSSWWSTFNVQEKREDKIEATESKKSEGLGKSEECPDSINSSKGSDSQ